MSSSLSTTLSLIAQRFNIYFGVPLFILGISGSILALIVMLSLQTFRQNSCAFYLIVMQFSNIGDLLAGLLSRILANGFEIDLTDKISAICKLRAYSIHPFTETSLTCLCLATIDQYLATSSCPSWQRWSNLKVAHRLTFACTIIWPLHAVLYLIFADVITIPSSKISYCSTSSSFFLKYHTYVNVITLTCILPILVLITFGSLAYYNVRHMSYRTIPLVRQELDKQLTTMVLLQVFLNLFTLVPFAIANTLSIIPQFTNNSITSIYINFFNNITGVVFHMYFAGSFYIYICTSERFRRQLIYVLFQICLKQCRRRRILKNTKIAPQV